MTFEFGRRFEGHAYRSLLMHLLGGLWITFELFWVTLLVIAISWLASSLTLASFGIFALVASGYSVVSWGILVICLVPLLTVGMSKIVRQR